MAQELYQKEDKDKEGSQLCQNSLLKSRGTHHALPMAKCELCGHSLFHLSLLCYNSNDLLLNSYFILSYFIISPKKVKQKGSLVKLLSYDPLLFSTSYLFQKLVKWTILSWEFDLFKCDSSPFIICLHLSLHKVKGCILSLATCLVLL